MPTLLAITVGGSCVPIVTAIRDFAPGLVIFFVSTGSRGSRVTVDGKEKPCQGEPSILAQTGLPGEACRIVELSDPDALHLCFAEMKRALGQAQAEHPEWRRIVDYTGGTKSMSAALTLAALEAGWEISLIKGARTDLVKVVNGTEMTSLVNAWDLRLQQRMSEVENLFNQFAYASAGALLESQLRSGPLSLELEKTVKQVVALCRGFDLWDRFAHDRAYQLLQPFQAQVVPQWKFLKQLVGEAKASGYERALDLRLNAERRVERGRYDDAIARLYRALEMIAQVRLAQRQPGLDAGDLDPGCLPVELRARYRRIRRFNQASGRGPKIAIALREDYELLAGLDDPLGEVYRSHEKMLLSALEKRNHSILAHGVQPLGKNEFGEMKQTIDAFFEAAFQALGVRFSAVQFPRLSEGVIVQR